MTMKNFGITALATATIISVSCMSDMSPEQANQDILLIEGQVFDESGMPIEHIRVTLQDKAGNRNIQYTSNIGAFASDYFVYNPSEELTIILEDIDGQEHGGLYESKTDIIKIFGDDRIIKRDYRLNLATASESNPQP